MERRLFDAFNDLFEKKLSNSLSRLESFEEAQKQFEQSYGWSGYKNYESFKVTRSRKMKRR